MSAFAERLVSLLGEDVHVEWGAVSPPADAVRADVNPPSTACVTSDAVYFDIPDVARFRVSAERVVVEPAESADRGALLQRVRSVARKALLFCRGRVVLHASGVAVDGQAVLFLGTEDAGKSTMAAAMAERGWPLLADDAAVVRPDGRVAPIAARVKLDADAAARVGGQRLPDTEHGGYTFYRTDDETDPVPLGGLYFLSEGPDVSVESVDPQTVFTSLVGQSVTLKLHEAAGTVDEHFERCTALAQRARVRRLTRPHDFSALPGVVDTVEEDLRRALV